MFETTPLDHGALLIRERKAGAQLAFSSPIEATNRAMILFNHRCDIGFLFQILPSKIRNKFRLRADEVKYDRLPPAAFTRQFEHKGRPAEYGAGLKLAIERGWLWKHESGTYVKMT